MTEEQKSGGQPVLLGALAAAVVALIIFIMMPQPETASSIAVQSNVTSPAEAEATTQAPAPEVAASAAEDAEPAVTQTPELDTTAVENAAESAAPAETAPEAAPSVTADAPAAPEGLPGPEFDTFRVELDGMMVIAGRATPGQVVAIMLGDEEIDRVTVDRSGSFVALPVAGPSDQPRRLSMVVDPDGAAVESQASFIVAPIAAPVVVAEADDVVDDVASDELSQNAEALDTVSNETAPEVAGTLATPEIEATTTAPQIDTASAAPPTVLQADADGVRIVQGEQAEPADNVALDTITYDSEGEVQLAGRATSDGAVQIYINNEPLTTTGVNPEGNWALDLPEIDTGVYTLRIDEVDETGDVVSRLETPFKREEPEEVAAVMAEETAQDGFEVAVRTVQPGSTLWAIAEENLGDGILYVAVFEANRDLIRDPDLIYPGQIFRIPELDE